MGVVGNIDKAFHEQAVYSKDISRMIEKVARKPPHEQSDSTARLAQSAKKSGNHIQRFARFG